MNPAANSDQKPTPEIGKPVQTACGGWVIYSPETPCALYRGELVYFCMPTCKADYEISPETSCLAGHILLDKSKMG
jgi:hypothetical protein